MAISITIKKFNGREYVYIIDSFRDPITKRATTRTLEHYGNKDKLLEKDPDALKKLEKRVHELRSNSKAYSEVLSGTLCSNAHLDEQNLKRGSCYGITHAVYAHVWNALGLDSYLRNATHNYKLKYDLAKAVFFGATSRIVHPDSKRATCALKGGYLIDFDDIKLGHLYDSLSELAQRKEQLIDRMNAAIGKLYQRDLTVAFYDVTTFYFESFIDDTVKNRDGTSKRWIDMPQEEKQQCGLRSRGMSKEHRTQETQVVLGLLIDSEGIPITYEIFPGNTAETYTLLEVVSHFQKQYQIKDVTVVADSGLNSLINLKELEKRHFNYIVGYPPYTRLKAAEQNEFLNPAGWKRFNTLQQEWRYKDLNLAVSKQVIDPRSGKRVKVQLDARLIGTYSQQRYEHDRWELQEKYTKAKKLVEKGKGAVNAASRTGYKAFVKASTEQVDVNEELYNKRLKWCGYMALLTNIKTIEPLQIYFKLRQLWRIEDNFRVMKTNLEARPVYVWTPEHIRGHFMMNYIGLVMQRLMLRQLSNAGLNISAEEVVRALESIKVTRLQALKKANNNLYSCSNVQGYAATAHYPQVGLLTLSAVADEILKICNLQPLNALETAESIKRKLKIKMPIRGE